MHCNCAFCDRTDFPQHRKYFQTSYRTSCSALYLYYPASVSLNLVVGYSGELSLGHAGFMCVGAFSSALFHRLLRDVIPNRFHDLCLQSCRCY